MNSIMILPLGWQSPSHSMGEIVIEKKTYQPLKVFGMYYENEWWYHVGKLDADTEEYQMLDEVLNEQDLIFAPQW